MVKRGPPTKKIMKYSKNNNNNKNQREWYAISTNKLSDTDFEPQGLKPGLNGNSISKALKLRRDLKETFRVSARNIPVLLPAVCQT